MSSSFETTGEQQSEASVDVLWIYGYDSPWVKVYMTCKHCLTLIILNSQYILQNTGIVQGLHDAICLVEFKRDSEYTKEFKKSLPEVFQLQCTV